MAAFYIPPILIMKAKIKDAKVNMRQREERL